ncbi:hypothetical protein MAR_022888 [Mya arenaria]|uniref:Uncharacterized protein n=1 Tax=Mya arenaria TaxID=6604 RepID=A0ABY7DQ86_MYAAR|nr:hypothetical protein MAR_022888 [Mya arenaria]
MNKVSNCEFVCKNVVLKKHLKNYFIYNRHCTNTISSMYMLFALICNSRRKSKLRGNDFDYFIAGSYIEIDFHIFLPSDD